MTPTMHPTIARMSGTWTIEDVVEILNRSGNWVTIRDVHAAIRSAGWIQGRWAGRVITEKGWPYVDQVGDFLVFTGAGIAAVHRELGGVGEIRVETGVLT